MRLIQQLTFRGTEQLDNSPLSVLQFLESVQKLVDNKVATAYLLDDFKLEEDVKKNQTRVKELVDMVDSWHDWLETAAGKQYRMDKQNYDRQDPATGSSLAAASTDSASSSATTVALSHRLTLPQLPQLGQHGEGTTEGQQPAQVWYLAGQLVYHKGVDGGLRQGESCPRDARGQQAS